MNTNKINNLRGDEMFLAKWFVLSVVLLSAAIGYTADANIAIDPYLVEEKAFLGYGINWGDYSDRVLSDAQWNG
jgi:hypothetical protein